MVTTEQAFIAREEEWMAAVQRKDHAALEKILAEEYVYTASGQGRWSRQRWLDTVAIYDIHHFDFTDIRVQAYGEVAVVHTSYHQEGSVDGTRRSGEFLITDVWVDRDGRWQVVTRSSILMPEPSGAPG